MYVVSTVLAVSFIVYAGNMNPSLSPSKTMVSIDDLYKKASDLNYLLSSSDYDYLSTSSVPASSMHTLEDVWNILDGYSGCTYEM